MANRLSIFFTISLIVTNLTIICPIQRLELVVEIALSYEEAERRLNSFLPDTLISQKHHSKYNLLKELDTQTKKIIKLNSSELLNPRSKELLVQYLSTNTAALCSCETEYTIMPDLYDENNSDIDGNDFNIIYTYQAYKKCVKEILSRLPKEISLSS